MGQRMTWFARRELAKQGYTTTKTHVVAPDGTIHDPDNVTIREVSVQMIVKDGGTGRHSSIQGKVTVAASGRSRLSRYGAEEHDLGFWRRIKLAGYRWKLITPSWTHLTALGPIAMMLMLTDIAHTSPAFFAMSGLITVAFILMEGVWALTAFEV